LIVFKLSGRDYDSVLTLATSWPMFSLMLTGLSNTIETIILGVTIFVVLRNKGKTWHEYVLYGGLLAFGEFARITFVLYAFPLALFLLYEEMESRTKDWASLITGILFGFSLVSAIIIIIDSVYYGSILISIGGTTFRWFDLLCPSFYLNLMSNITNISLESLTWTISPVNNIIYNSDPENLNKHGTHLRITHMFNLFVLFGPLAYVAIEPYYTWLDEKLGVMVGQLPGRKKEAKTVSKKKLLQTTGNTVKTNKAAIRVQEGKFAHTKLALLASIVAAFIILSLIPHQEMRFLLPMLVPLVLLGYKKIFGNEGFFWLKVCWIGFNIFFLLTFAIFHQGGVVPAILNLSSRPIEPGSTQHVIFYHTYMPPQHLFAIEKSGKPKHVVYDLMGKSLTDLRKALLRTPEQFSYSPKDKIYVVAPATVDLDPISKVLLLDCRFWFHWSGEDSPQSFFSLNELFLNIYLYNPSVPMPVIQQTLEPDTTQ